MATSAKDQPIDEVPTLDDSGKVYIVIALDEAAVQQFTADKHLQSLQVVHCTTREQAEDAANRQMPDRDTEIVDLTGTSA